MSDTITLKYDVSTDDFTRAGEASSDVKRKLKNMNVNPEAVRKVAIAMYEGEINMVIHANGGVITVTIDPDCITMVLADKGPGIPAVSDIHLFSPVPDTHHSASLQSPYLSGCCRSFFGHFPAYRTRRNRGFQHRMPPH